MSSAFDFSDDSDRRDSFIDWIENMDDEEFQSRLNSDRDQGGFTNAQKSWALSIREEMAEEEGEPTPAQLQPQQQAQQEARPTQGQPQNQPPTPRQSRLQRLRRFFFGE